MVSTLTNAAAAAIARRLHNYDVRGLPDELRERVYYLAHPKAARYAAREGNAVAARVVAERKAAKLARSKRHGLPQGPLNRLNWIFGPHNRTQSKFRRTVLLRHNLFPSHNGFIAFRNHRPQKLRNRYTAFNFNIGEIPPGAQTSFLTYTKPTKVWDGRRWVTPQSNDNARRKRARY